MARTSLRIAAILVGAGVVAFLCLVLYVQLLPAGPEPVAPVSGPPAQLAGMSRGEYLTKAADCAACHTAKSGGVPYAGDRAFKLPFGTLYSTNITPDKETGIGNMSDDDFVRAVRQGVGSHGRLYPAMSYTSYTGMSRDDVLAIKQYLMTLKPIHQVPTSNDLAFPFNQRWGMWFWNVAFFRDRRFAPDPAQSAQWNRGAYLAGPLGHCAECHTPRNLGFALKTSRSFAGEMTDGWKAYNISSDKQDGIGNWTDDQLTAFLRSGHAPGRSSAAGPMAEVVQNSTQYLSPGDMKALIAYLRSVPAQSGGESGGPVDLNPAASKASNAVLPDTASLAHDNPGLHLFEGDCAGCHQYNGKGRQTDHAALTGSRAVNDPSGTALVQILLHGGDLKTSTGNQLMPAFGGTYSDADIANVANYVLAHFGSKQGTVTAQQVAKQRKE